MGGAGLQLNCAPCHCGSYTHCCSLCSGLLLPPMRQLLAQPRHTIVQEKCKRQQAGQQHVVDDCSTQEGSRGEIFAARMQSTVGWVTAREQA